MRSSSAIACNRLHHVDSSEYTYKYMYFLSIIQASYLIYLHIKFISCLQFVCLGRVSCTCFVWTYTRFALQLLYVQTLIIKQPHPLNVEHVRKLPYALNIVHARKLFLVNEHPSSCFSTNVPGNSPPSEMGPLTSEQDRPRRIHRSYVRSFFECWS